MQSTLVASLTAALLLTACARTPVEPLGTVNAPTYTGPDMVQVDLLRPTPGGSRIFVQATLPDGEPGLFLVDTGAATSALSVDTADRLGLDIDYEWGYVEGLGGRASLDRAELPSLEIGDAVIPGVEFAVGVPGIPTYVGAMPLDGILGNNVWSRFVLEVDYPADTLVLHRPGTVRMPRKSDPMFYDGSHVFAPITITTQAEVPHTDRVVIQVDTGASGLMLAGAHGKRFEQDYTEGLEPIFGIGAAENMPASQFLQVTRHVPVAEVEVGGRTVTAVREARWVNFDGTRELGPRNLKGLAGHDLLDGHVVFFDYRGGRLALKKSRRKARLMDGHQVMLEQDLARYGAEDRSRFLHRARLHTMLGEAEEATALLEALIADPPESLAEDDDAVEEARVLLAAVRRARNDLDGAWEALSPLGAGALVDQREIIAAVNGLLLEERGDQALQLAQAAVGERPDEMASHVALSDALFAEQRWEEADAALIEASRIAENPDAHLLRRARISLAQGDRYGAMANLRKLLTLYPYEGLFIWFYAELVEPDADGDTFRYDMETAIARLHPGDRPLDFMVAAHTTLGDHTRALRLMDEGIARDCVRMQSQPSENNCLAWYYALADTRTTDALRLIDDALEQTGNRSDFLDTKAMVHLARGEYADAHAAAVAAARLNPDDIYMLWQAERLAQLVEQSKGVTEAAEARR